MKILLFVGLMIFIGVFGYSVQSFFAGAVPEDRSSWGHRDESVAIISDSRPQFEGMLNRNDLVPGEFVYLTRKSMRTEILILSIPYLQYGDCRVDYATWVDGQPLFRTVEQFSCADWGLMEYQPGVWNELNHILASPRPALGYRELNTLMDTLFQNPELWIGPKENAEF